MELFNGNDQCVQLEKIKVCVESTSKYRYWAASLPYNHGVMIVNCALKIISDGRNFNIHVPNFNHIKNL